MLTTESETSNNQIAKQCATTT